MDLLERDAALLTFDRALSATRLGGGHVMLVSGEAGIGKTTLLKAMAARRGDATLWWGACDSLGTPHPLAPLHDIARTGDVAFKPLLQRADVCASVVGTNAKSGVTWVHSYVSDDLRKTFCVYDAPTPDAIRETARNNNLPIDSITSVSVLDPYFYRG